MPNPRALNRGRSTPAAAIGFVSAAHAQHARHIGLETSAEIESRPPEPRDLKTPQRPLGPLQGVRRDCTRSRPPRPPRSRGGVREDVGEVVSEEEHSRAHRCGVASACYSLLALQHRAGAARPGRCAIPRLKRLTWPSTSPSPPTPQSSAPPPSPAASRR